MVSKKENMNERILFLLNRYPLQLTDVRDSFKIYFHEMEKLLPVERIFEKLEENRLRCPENQFPEFVVKMNLLWSEKSFNCQKYLKNGKKLVSTSQKTHFH